MSVFRIILIQSEDCNRFDLKVILPISLLDHHRALLFGAKVVQFVLHWIQIQQNIWTTLRDVCVLLVHIISKHSPR